MEYLSSSDLENTRELAENNKVVRFLKKLGYKFIFVGSGSSMMTGEEADINFTNNDFYRIVQSITVLGHVIDHRGRILGAFSDTEKAAKIEGPKFVMAHILVPHPPFIFGENGEAIDSSYLEQLKFTNKKLMEAVEKIFAASGSAPPVVIIQSDHGTTYVEGFKIREGCARRKLRNFGAYYIPGKDAALPSDMGAVNTFRFLFDLYFGTNFGFLEDQCYPFLEDQLSTQ